MTKREVLNCEKASRGAFAFEIRTIVTNGMGVTSKYGKLTGVVQLTTTREITNV